MSLQPRILAFAGSLRKDSVNKKLVRLAARGAEQAGASVTVIDLADFPLPVFDEDLEASKGMPEQAARLKQLFLDHAGLLIASPEYNSSLSAALKNAIDWVSRSPATGPRASAFESKVAAILSGSPGNLGGLRGLVHLRAILGNVGVLVIPDQVAVPKALDAFGPDGQLKDAKIQESVLAVGKTLAQVIGKLHRD